MDYEYFGLNLRCFRQLRGLSQHELARLARSTIRQADISNYERGLRPSGSHDLTVLADALEVSVEAFLRRPRFIKRVDEDRPSVFRSQRETGSVPALQMAGQES